MNLSGKVWYEGWFKGTKASYERFGRALVEHDVEFKKAFQMGPGGETVTVQVKCRPAQIETFSKALKMRPEDFRYSSQTVFDNGTLVPVYASPEDELADKKTVWASRVLAKWVEREREENGTT